MNRPVLLTTLVMLGALLFSGCTTGNSLQPTAHTLKEDNAAAAQIAAMTLTAMAPQSSQPTGTPTPEFLPATPDSVAAPSLTPTITQTPRPVVSGLCSPLDGVALEDMGTIISNAYQPPATGQDNGHMGVDYAFYRYGDRVGMAGLPIHSVLPGTIVASILDQHPYGNTVIVETPLKELPGEWLDALNLPSLSKIPNGNINLSCPDLTPPLEWDFENPSLYLLYGHMVAPTPLRTGQRVECGGEIGGVGTTGDSVNEHLHLEVRLGPGRASFDGMTHYAANALEQDRLNYCLWRVSGFFRMTDPMVLLSLQ